MLDHPNIIKFHDVYKDRSIRLNIVMEYASNGNLKQRMARVAKEGKKFTEPEVLAFIVQILLGLKYCHAN